MFLDEEGYIKESDYIYYNSLVSIKLVSETNHPHQKDFYMLRMENLDQSLILKRCETPLLQYSDLKESLFYIRNIDECINIFGNKNNETSQNKRQNTKEFIFKNNLKINFNQSFLFQHMISKKFISVEKLQGSDNYILKLVSDLDKALSFPFFFKRINNSSEYLTYKSIVYIYVYNKEKGQNFYINHNNLDLDDFPNDERKLYNNTKNNEDKKNMMNLANYGDLCVINSNYDKFYIINQIWFINDKDSLYNGQLVNIIFSIDKGKEKEKMMLAAEGIKNTNKFEEVIGIKEEVREDIDGLMRDNNQKYILFHGFTDRIKEKINNFSSIIIKGIPYKDNLYEHVVNNAFWVIEKKTLKQNELNTEPIKIRDLVRIKNPLLGLYLIVKKKNKDTKISNNEAMESSMMKKSGSGLINTNNPINGNSNYTNNSGNMNNNNTSNKNQNNISNNNINNNNNTSSYANNYEDDELEFELVSEETFEEKYFYYNFKFFHYNVNEEKKMTSNGKYILKTDLIHSNENSEKVKTFNKKNKFGKSYFEPISLNNLNSNNTINIKVEDDFIIDIEKIDFEKGNEVIFLQNVISDLDYILKKYKKKKASASNVIKKITENINFFMEYLLNINYMFKNDNFEINRPVEERQLLLYNFNILQTIKEIINYFFPIVKDINNRDFSLLDKSLEKSKSQKLLNFKRASTKEPKDIKFWDEDSKIYIIKSMLKLILKFMIYLSKNNEDIKKDIFNNLTQILEFSDYIYTSDKSDLLNFIFEILDDSETLQDDILVKKFTANQLLSSGRTDGVLYIDKILSYIETNYNFLFYYKKLIGLNKIRYREKELKEKVSTHLAKVEKDFRINKNSNNYRGKIYLLIKNLTELVENQIKEWEKYLENKNNEQNQNNNNYNYDYSENNITNQILRRDINVSGSNNKRENSSEINTKNSRNNYDLRKIDEYDNEDEKDAESNDYLNGRSLFSPRNKKKNLFDVPKNFDDLKKKTNDININKNANDKIIESDAELNNYKKSENELIELAKNKINFLNKVIDFLDYFNTINLSKILFRNEELFKKMLKLDIKDELLDYNLNFIINGNACSIKFITDLDFCTETTIGTIIPYYIFNNFFINDAENPIISNKNKDKYNIADFQIIENEHEEDNSEEKLENLGEENEEKEDDNIDEEKEEDVDIFNDNIDNLNIDKYSTKKNNKVYDLEEKNLDKNIKSDRRLTSQNQNPNFTFLIKNQFKRNEDVEDILNNNIDELLLKKEPFFRRKKKYQSVYQNRKKLKTSANNLLKEEAKKNELSRFLEKCKEEDQKIDKYLYILYSIYFFCINECLEINYKFIKILINYFINYDKFAKFKLFKESINFIQNEILSKFVFINKNSIFKNIFDKIKKNSTLLEDNFDLKNFIENNENYSGALNNDNKNKIETTNITNNIKIFQENNYFTKLKQLSSEEIIFLDFLIYYCKLNDQINYLLEKILSFKNIQQLIYNFQRNSNSNADMNTKNEDKDKIDIEIKKVMRQLISNKFTIISLYEKFNMIKNKFFNYQNTMRMNILEEYGIFKQSDFMLWLLEQYEIDKYFNNIIYLEINPDNSSDNNSFDKLMNIKNLFDLIESEIHKAKEENEKKSIINIIKKNDEIKENHYKIICNKLMTVTRKVLFNIFSGKESGKEQIIEMLIEENENFFVKIGFLNTLKIMVESIESYDSQYNIINNNHELNENNYILKLNYCKEVLRTFLEIKNTFPEFNKLVADNLDTFKSMIINSLKTINIKELQNNLNNKEMQKEREKNFLCICYYCSDILLFVLNYNKNIFTEIYSFIKEIFDLLIRIYQYFHSPKNIVTYQLFYNYLIIRISLILDKEKKPESFSFENFFNEIFNIELMRFRILTCINHLQSYNVDSTEDDDFETSERNEEQSKIRKSEKLKFELWKDKTDNKLYEFQDKKSNNKTIEDKTMNSKNNINRDINFDNISSGLNYHKKEILWETEEEKEKLIFFIYFTSAYIIYLKDKSTAMDDNDNLEEEENDIEFNFNTLGKKIKNLLNSSRNLDDTYINNPTIIKNAKRYNSLSQSIKSSTYTKAKINKFHNEEITSTMNNNTNYNNYLFGENEKKKKDFYITNNTKNNLPQCEDKYNFELVLLESIAGYKFHIKDKIIEIPVKNIENKLESEDSNYISESNSNETAEQDKEKKEEESKILNLKQNGAKIKFYYYETIGIDLLFLEKIFKDVEIYKNLRYYCTNTNEEYKPIENSKLLNDLLELQNKLESLNSGQKKEYELLHKQFIKNDMKKFIKNFLNTFNKSDFEGIDLMQNYSFNRFNEIYPYDSLYGINEKEKISSLVKTLKKYEIEIEKEYFGQLISENNEISDNSILHLFKSDIVIFLNSLIYLYPHYDKKICLIFFKTGFLLLYTNCMKIDSKSMNRQTTKTELNTNPDESELDLNSILNAIILLFSRDINHSIIESKQTFSIILNSINAFLKKIKDNHIFVLQNKELIQEFFHNLDFILKHLTKDFEKIVNFIKISKSQQKSNKYMKIEQSLNYLINFVTTLISFKKIDKDILTNEIINFIQDIVENLISLINLLMEQNTKSSFQTVGLLLNFIYYFIEGPDIENFRTLFNKGYYNLISNSINKIDYYNLFKSDINKENLHEIIDNKIEEEYRIIKIFLMFYSLCHHEYKGSDEFITMRHWYDENFKNIKLKLKKIYYLSKKEMENREYDLDQMLLFLKENDSYSSYEIAQRSGIVKYDITKDKDTGFEEKVENETKMPNNKKQKNENTEKKSDYFSENVKIKKNTKYSKYCMIKFDLILIYYSLFSFYQDSFNDKFLSVPPGKSIINSIYFIVKQFFLYIKYIVLCPFYISYFIYNSCRRKEKTNIELLQELSDIDIKCQTLDEEEMLKFLSSKIKYVEISLDYRLFKVYYPILNKTQQIQKNKDFYLQVDNSQLSDYVKYIFNNYDTINLIASQHYKIRKLFELPALSIIFNNDRIYSLFLLILGLSTNIIIILSYSTFTQTNCDYIHNEDNDDIRMNCPHFLYDEESEHEKVIIILSYFGNLMLMIQLILFVKYMIQSFAETIGIYRNNYLKDLILLKKKYSNLSYAIGFIPNFLNIFKSFDTIYFLLSLLFINLGLYFHPFFYCFALFEFVKRVEIMQIILKAIYVPILNVLSTILLCIILEYIFSMISLAFYLSHFPNVNDTKNMLNAFIRMFDQTFKQDGGVGRYLDIRLEPGYIPFNPRYFASSRFFFDLIFFLLINMIAFPLFFIIIIDYFSKSKEKTEEFTELSESKCLICELERESLEKIYSNSKKAFELHINHIHGLINYICYLVYLQALGFRDPIIESNVWKLHLSNNLNYLPKAVCFKQKEKEMFLEYYKK